MRAATLPAMVQLRNAIDESAKVKRELFPEAAGSESRTPARQRVKLSAAAGGQSDDGATDGTAAGAAPQPVYAVRTVECPVCNRQLPGDLNDAQIVAHIDDCLAMQQRAQLGAEWV